MHVPLGDRPRPRGDSVRVGESFGPQSQKLPGGEAGAPEPAAMGVLDMVAAQLELEGAQNT